MKTIYCFFLCMTLGLFALTSCDTNELDPLEGVYPAPTISDVSQVVQIDKTSDKAGLRHFTIQLTGRSDRIVLEMIGSEYYLQSATFAPNVNQTPTVNTYIAENSTVNGSKVQRGNVLVMSEDNHNYEVCGVLWTEDGKIVKFSANGVLSYEPDPVVVEPIIGTGTVETSPLYGSDANGNWGPIEGCFEHVLTVMDGEQELAVFDIYSADEVNLSGTYTVAENRPETGVMNNGWIWESSFGGTTIIQDGVPYMVKSGEVTVEDNGLEIIVSCYGATTQDGAGNTGPVNFVYKIQK